MKEAIKFTTIVLFILALLAGIIMWPLPGFIVLVALFILLGFYDIIQKKHAILRNYPVIGHIRFMLEMISPEIHQYFVESNTDGKPIDRNQRSYVYERAKRGNANKAFWYGAECI